MAKVGLERLYLIGDSLTQLGFQHGGWLSAVADRYLRRYDVINRGFNGYNTDYIRLILSDLLRRDDVKRRADIAAATILLGSNDAVLAQQSKRNVPLERYASNLKHISSLLAAAGIDHRRQIIVGVPPVVESKWREVCESKLEAMNLSNLEARKYARTCADVAKELNTPFVELYESMMAEKSWTCFFSDGVHFSSEGNQFVAERVCDALDAVLPYIDPLYPDYSDIDANDPAASLHPMC